MPQISLEVAQPIIEAALAGDRSAPSRRIAIAVCDAGAHPVALAHEDGAAPLLAHIARAKAFTCAAHGKPTDLVRAWAAAIPGWFAGVTNVAQRKMSIPLIGSKGGVTIQNRDGRAVGEFVAALAQRGIESAGLVAIAN